MFGLENLPDEKDIHPYLHREVFGGYSANIYPTYVGYMSRDISQTYILLGFSPLLQCM